MLSSLSAISFGSAKPSAGVRLGRKPLDEIKGVLGQTGLYLGMEVPGWPPDDIDELAKRFEDDDYRSLARAAG